MSLTRLSLFERFPRDWQKEIITFLDEKSIHALEISARRIYGPIDLDLRHVYAKKAWEIVTYPSKKYFEYEKDTWESYCWDVRCNGFRLNWSCCSEYFAPCVGAGCAHVPGIPLVATTYTVVGPISYACCYAGGAISDLRHSHIFDLQQPPGLTLFAPRREARLLAHAKENEPPQQKM